MADTTTVIRDVRDNLKDVLKMLAGLPDDLPVEFHDPYKAIVETVSEADKKVAADSEALSILIEANELGDEASIEEAYKKVDERSKQILDDGVFHGALEKEVDEQRKRIDNVAGGAKNENGSDEDDDDDSMMVIGKKYNRKDPITMADIKHPVKNKHCGHVYERDSIHAMIEAQKKKKAMFHQCPVAGCQNKKNVELDHLVDFPDFFNHLD